jgi:hypothetical protein
MMTSGDNGATHWKSQKAPFMKMSRPGIYIYIYIPAMRECRLHMREIERKRERERTLKVGGKGAVVRDTTMVGGSRKQYFRFFKFPRQCPLVLLVWIKFVFRISSKLSF